MNDKENSAANQSLENLVRSKITKANGGEPVGEFTGEFLRELAGLTSDEIRQAVVAGILVDGEHHLTLAESMS